MGSRFLTRLTGLRAVPIWWVWRIYDGFAGDPPPPVSGSPARFGGPGDSFLAFSEAFEAYLRDLLR